MAKTQSTLTVEQITELYLNNCVSKKLETLIRRAARVRELSPCDVIGNGAHCEAFRILEHHGDHMRYADDIVRLAWKQQRKLGGVA